MSGDTKVQITKAPAFRLSDQNGEVHSLEDYRGRWLVLYFYPKDDTPGCTAEACYFRDARQEIADNGKAEIVGVSTDSVASHKKFAEKHDLNFTLLSDPDHQVIAAYDSWKPHKLPTPQFLNTARNTFIIDPDGNIVKTYLGVDPQVHATQIIEDLKELQAA